jgi:hypothetical protein
MLGLLLPPTLAWKLYIGVENPNEFTERTLAFLTRSGFEARIVDEMLGMQVVSAIKGDCHMFVADRAGTGWTRQLIDSLGEDTKRNFIVFRGGVYNGDPTWLLVIATICLKNLRRLGLARSAIVAGVAASPGCDSEPVMWTEL